ncbi:hypothetical protein GCM10023169_29090 [Georgenia halophila]|uniref:Uncharacterized protein n=1 Tax=Georgenia halophila TaxID=620889 RepID=A0ABP8LEN4_9MICO
MSQYIVGTGRVLSLTRLTGAPGQETMSATVAPDIHPVDASFLHPTDHDPTTEAAGLRDAYDVVTFGVVAVQLSRLAEAHKQLLIVFAGRQLLQRDGDHVLREVMAEHVGIALRPEYVDRML